MKKQKEEEDMLDLAVWISKNGDEQAKGQFQRARIAFTNHLASIKRQMEKRRKKA